jgi:iron complex outermembrane receptor protein
MIGKVRNVRYICFVIALVSSNVALTQNDSTSYYELSLYELAQLKIISEKQYEQKLINSSSTFRVITKAQIEGNAYFTLEDVLADLPGFQFRNILGLNSYSFLRGLPRQNNAIIILIDGIQINELNSGGFYGGGQYNMANVERIEVLYGPASVKYGSNAISGIINIVTKNPVSSEMFQANTTIGTFNTYHADLSYSSLTKKGGFLLSAMYKSSDKANLTGDNNDNLWGYNMELYETDYAMDFKYLHNNITIGVNYQNRRSSTTTHNPSNGTVHKGFGTLWNLQLMNTWFKHKKPLTDNISLQSVFFYRNATIKPNSVKEVTDTGQIAYYRPNHLAGLESILEVKVTNKLNFTSGVFAHYELLANGYSNTYSTEYFYKPEQPESPDTKSNVMTGLFMQLNYIFFKYWQFVPAIRYEHSSSYGAVLTPRASLIFYKNKYSSKLIYGRAFRAPKPWDYTDGVGNSGLEPEYFNSFEFSNTLFLSKNLMLDLSVFNNYLSNGIVKVNDSNGNFYWDNSDKATTMGLELGLSIKHEKFNALGNYCFTKSMNSINEPLSEISPHMASLGVNYPFTKFLSASIKSYYTGKRKNPKLIQATGSEYIDEALVINFMLSVTKIKNTTIKFVINNLTNKEYYHPSNLKPDRIRQPQRLYMLKLTYKIL